jgi:hypothetical protein
MFPLESSVHHGALPHPENDNVKRIIFSLLNRNDLSRIFSADNYRPLAHTRISGWKVRFDGFGPYLNPTGWSDVDACELGSKWRPNPMQSSI